MSIRGGVLDLTPSARLRMIDGQLPRRSDRLRMVGGNHVRACVILAAVVLGAGNVAWAQAPPASDPPAPSPSPLAGQAEVLDMLRRMEVRLERVNRRNVELADENRKL